MKDIDFSRAIMIVWVFGLVVFFFVDYELFMAWGMSAMMTLVITASFLKHLSEWSDKQ